MAAVTRRSYVGAAPACTLTNSITAGDTTALLTGTVTAWNDTANGPFFMVIDPGLVTEEKVLVGSRTGSSLSSITRGVDNTTAASHAAGATCYPVFTATDANEANLFASTMTTRGDLLTMGSGPTVARIGIGTTGYVLKSDGTDASWAISPETDLVTTKGDLLVATAADTLARQGVGANGQVLVADSGVTNGVAWVDPLTNRNVVINGAMQVAQRGTSTASITTNGYYTADRFTAILTTCGTWTQSVEADAPTGSGFRNSLKMLCTTADASPTGLDQVRIDQYLEGQDLQQFAKGTASAKQFSLSFWAKANVTGTYIVTLIDADNNRICCGSYSISASATWEKKTITFPADTTGAFDNDNNASLRIVWWLAAGTDYTSGTLQTTWAANTNANRAVGQTNLAAATDNYWQVTGVQLEAGAVATPFEFEDYGTTLAKCQRYYVAIESLNNSYATFGSGYVVAGGGGAYTIHLPVAMRANPTTFTSSAAGTFYLDAAAGAGIGTSITAIQRATRTSFQFVVGLAGMTAGQGTMLLADGVDTAFVAASAEL